MLSSLISAWCTTNSSPLRSSWQGSSELDWFQSEAYQNNVAATGPSVMGLIITSADPSKLWCGPIPSGLSSFLKCPQMKSIKLQMGAQPDPSSKVFWLPDTVCMKTAIRVEEMGGIPGMWKKDSWVRDEDTRREKRAERDNSSPGPRHVFPALSSGATSTTSTDETMGGHRWKPRWHLPRSDERHSRDTAKKTKPRMIHSAASHQHEKKSSHNDHCFIATLIHTLNILKYADDKLSSCFF